MKATGIVRRVDDIGRIVIPKEIRRTLKIREGDPSYTTFTSEEQFKWAITNIYIWCRNKGLCEITAGKEKTPRQQAVGVIFTKTNLKIRE